MNRPQLEHVVRARAEIVRDNEFIIGSQSILGAFPDAPTDLLRSMDLKGEKVERHI